MRFLIIPLLMWVSSISGTHFLIEEGNQCFREDKFEEAYEKFSWYLFQFALNGSPEDYYVALIGKNSCARRLGNMPMFRIERDHIYLFIDGESWWEEEGGLASSIIHQSVFWDDLEKEGLKKLEPQKSKSTKGWNFLLQSLYFLELRGLERGLLLCCLLSEEYDKIQKLPFFH
jgi:hypothetical protein